MSARDVETLRSGYADFNHGDLTAFVRNVHEDFVVSDRQELLDGRTYSGFEGAVQAATGAGEGFEDYRIEPDEFIEVGEHVIIVVATQSGRGSASGAVVEGPIVHLWRMRDGKATSMQAYSSKEQALAALEEEKE
jgi:ketosteroid isomerase-like protein